MEQQRQSLTGLATTWLDEFDLDHPWFDEVTASGNRADRISLPSLELDHPWFI